MTAATEQRRKRLALAMCARDCELLREGKETISYGKACGEDAPCDGWRHWLPYADVVMEEEPR